MIDQVTVYESLLLWSNTWLSLSTALVLFLIAVINVIFTSFVATEQIQILYNEMRYKSESVRLEKFLRVKDRLMLKNEDCCVIQVPYLENCWRKSRVITIVALLVVSALLSCMPFKGSELILTILGAFTTPIVMQLIPGYLFW